jgi:hypothetical protein
MEDEVKDDSNAIDSMTAGYNKSRGIEQEAPAPEVEAAPVEQAEPEAVEVAAVEPPAPDLAAEVAALKAQIAELGGTSASVRKIYGELGNINRVVKQLQAAPQGAAGQSEKYAEVLKKAETVAEEFPELAGPLVELVKELSSTPRAASSPSVDIEAVVASRVSEMTTQQAVEMLADEHPDFMEVRTTPEYEEWLNAKGTEFREKFINSMNPFYVSKHLSEFKAQRDAARAAKEVKKNRLEAAVTPTGEGASGPTVLPDTAGLSAGYNKVRRINAR